jgi:hypothetical protein
MNKQGQIFALRWMTAVFVLFLTLGYLNSFTDTISGARTDMDCDDTSISTGTQITCLGLDMLQWWWIGAILVAGFGILWERRTGG